MAPITVLWLLEPWAPPSTGSVEGGAIHCDGSAVVLSALSVRENEAFSLTAARGTGGGLAARDCTGSLEGVGFEANVANQAGGALWKGSAILTINGGGFAANVGRANIYSGAIMWDKIGDMVGCTRFADAQGNYLDIGEGCTSAERL